MYVYVCACVGQCVIQSVWLLSILIILLQAVNTRDRSFSLSRQALWCCTTSPSLPSLPLGVAHCFSSTSTSSTTVGASLSPSINQTINPSITQSSWRGIRCNMSLSLSLLNEGIVVSERERERERERECCCCCSCSLASREYVRVCYDTANSLSIVTLPTKHTMCVCDIERLG